MRGYWRLASTVTEVRLPPDGCEQWETGRGCARVSTRVAENSGDQEKTRWVNGGFKTSVVVVAQFRTALTFVDMMLPWRESLTLREAKRVEGMLSKFEGQ